MAGLLSIQKKYGKLPLKTVLAPAIALAEKGFAVYPAFAEALSDRAPTLARFASSRKIFLRPDGRPLQAGDWLVQKDLARTLKAIAARGHDGFYGGRVAGAIVREVKKAGGLISSQDLRFFKMKQREPVRGNFRGFEIASMPPPSSGGVHVIQILNVIEETLGKNPADPANIHLLASAMQRAFADRAEYLGDSDFVEVPLAGLLSKKYAAELRASISSYAATPSSSLRAGKPGNEPEHTTHLNVMDEEGNTVSSTQTINGWMGSGFVVEGTGVLMNNEMDDFSIKPGVANLYGAFGNGQNAVAPGKRPLSSMSPTILFRDGEPVLTLGSPSGTRILTCVAQTIANRFGYELPLAQAVASIRYHHQNFPDEIRVDAPGFPPLARADLEKRGYRINISNLGCRISAIERRGATLHGIADPRGEGISLGK